MAQEVNLVKLEKHLHSLKVELRKEMSGQLQAFREEIREQFMNNIHTQINRKINSQMMETQHLVIKNDSHLVNQLKDVKYRLQEQQKKIAQITNSMKKRSFQQEQDQKIEQLSSQFSELKTLVENKILVPTRINQIQHFFQNRINMVQRIINEQSPFCERFIIDRSMVEKKSDDGSYCQLIGKIPISHKPVNYFKIEETEKRWVLLGIIDAKHIQDQNSFLMKRKECIFYMIEGGAIGRSGKLHGGCKETKNGEKVMMSVFGSKISWVVEGQTRAKLKDEMILDNSICWVPFIAIQHKGDRIIWE